MKKIELISNKDNRKERREITEENMHLFPKRIREAFLNIKNNPYLDAGLISYQIGQKDFIINLTRKLFHKKPNLSFKEVTFQILDPLPSNLPPWNIVQVITYAKIEWENLKEKAGDKYIKKGNTKFIEVIVKEEAA